MINNLKKLNAISVQESKEQISISLQWNVQAQELDQRVQALEREEEEAVDHRGHWKVQERNGWWREVNAQKVTQKKMKW